MAVVFDCICVKVDSLAGAAMICNLATLPELHVCWQLWYTRRLHHSWVGSVEWLTAGSLQRRDRRQMVGHWAVFETSVSLGKKINAQLKSRKVRCLWGWTQERIVWHRCWASIRFDSVPESCFLVKTVPNLNDEGYAWNPRIWVRFETNFPDCVNPL